MRNWIESNSGRSFNRRRRELGARLEEKKIIYGHRGLAALEFVQIALIPGSVPLVIWEEVTQKPDLLIGMTSVIDLLSAVTLYSVNKKRGEMKGKRQQQAELKKILENGNSEKK